MDGLLENNKAVETFISYHILDDVVLTNGIARLDMLPTTADNQEPLRVDVDPEDQFVKLSTAANRNMSFSRITRTSDLAVRGHWFPSWQVIHAKVKHLVVALFCMFDAGMWIRCPCVESASQYVYQLIALLGCFLYVISLSVENLRNFMACMH